MRNSDQSSTFDRPQAKENARGGLSPLIDSAIVVLFLTALAYCGAYQYERAYLEHFAFPSIFVQVTLNALIRAAVTMFAMIVLVVGCISAACALSPQWDRKRCFLAIFLLVIALGFAVFAVNISNFRGITGFVER